MKGIILAGGKGTRLSPLTIPISKQLLPIYDKPMVYYPLSVLMLAEIKDILIITTPEDLNLFKKLLGNGENFGINLEYAIQEEPKGLAQAFILGEQFIGNDSVCLILGDSVFYGSDIREVVKDCTSMKDGAIVFAYKVSDPERYGVVSFDGRTGKVVSIEEKPKKPKSSYAIPGLYFYDNKASEYAKTLCPSDRGELEITDLNKVYMAMGSLSVRKLSRGIAWLDAGTYDSLMEAGTFVQAIEKRQGYKIGCLEEIGYRNGWITKERLVEIGKSMKNEYGEYLMEIAQT